MSIQNEIERLRFDIADSYSAVYEKYGELPSQDARNADNLPEAIRSIPDSGFKKYSIDPHKIGEWIDGKDIYEVTIVCHTPSGGTISVMADVSNLHIDILVDLSGTIIRYTDSRITQICFNFSSNPNAFVSAYIDNTNLMGWIGSEASSWGNCIAYVTLKYTAQSI